MAEQNKNITKIVMFLSNPYRPDSRVEREAYSLSIHGYQVTIICWDREHNFPPVEIVHGITIIRVQDAPSAYGKGWRQLFVIPRFWLSAWRKARQLRPNIVHAHDLDTLPVGFWSKARLGCRLVFDAHEDYPSLMILYLPKLLVNFLRLIEQKLAKRADAIITASSILAKKYKSAGLSSVITIGNYPDTSVFNTIESTAQIRTRISLGYSPEDYIVAYIGGFSKNRLIFPLIEAVKALPDIKLILAGDGHQREAIKTLVADAPNIQYVGWIPADQVPLYTLFSDVIYYCLLPDYPGAIYNAPNTLSNAMAAGKPILANDVGDLGRIVNQVGCGILIDPVNRNTITAALVSLKEINLRRRLGQLGKMAAQNEFNWGCAEKKLIDLYQHLILH